VPRLQFGCLAALAPLALCGCGAVPSPPSSRITTQQRTTRRRATASPAALRAGLGVFRDNGCGSCHTFVPAGTDGSVGPDLDTKPEQDAPRANMTLPAFVRQSIVDPNAYISPRYPKDVMPHGFGRKLSRRQLTDLVAFVATPP
jgi:mono/diheme cytochrome c family protein